SPNMTQSPGGVSAGSKLTGGVPGETMNCRQEPRLPTTMSSQPSPLKSAQLIRSSRLNVTEETKKDPGVLASGLKCGGALEGLEIHFWLKIRKPIGKGAAMTSSLSPSPFRSQMARSLPSVQEYPA